MRCQLTRARICELMEPAGVATYATEIGTSCSVTEATLTRGSWGADAAPDFWLQPASAAARTTASTATENSLVFIVCTAPRPRGYAGASAASIAPRHPRGPPRWPLDDATTA